MELKLSLEEKCKLCTGKDFWHSYNISDKGIPSLTMSDGPHGIRKQNGNADNLGIHNSVKAVCFPTAGCLSQSFDRNAAYLLGKLLSEEARAEGIHIILGPAMNIKRSPLCGRNFEYFSEDPFLTGELAANVVNGIQSGGVGACVKHFAANNMENGRMTVSANMSERTLREIYLKAFERVIKEQPAAVMSSYNRVNGEYAGESKKLICDILRGEWDFDGIVISDWYAVNNRVRAVLSGLDLEMPGGNAASYEFLLTEALKNEEVANAVTKCASRVADTAKKLFFEKTGGYDMEAHHNEAIKLASESAVLLKNESCFFPISRNEKVLFVGEYAEKPRFQGGGSSHINAYRVDGVLDGLSGYNIDYPDFCKNVSATNCLDKLKSVAKNYDKIIIFAGLPEEYESEGYDRESLEMPKYYYDIINCAVKTGTATGVILFNGSPVSMPFVNTVHGILEMGLGGEGVGRACKDIITGVTNPSGRLSESYPKQIEHTPAYINSKGLREVDYNEGVFIGYRYYTTKKIKTLFPFGYGLSYTKFKYSSLNITNYEGKLTVSFKIKNVGNCFGKEAAQLYISPCFSSYADRPVVELKEFKKVALEAGEEKIVNFYLNKSDFSYYDVSIGNWRTDCGEYRIMIGYSAEKAALSKNIAVNCAVKPPEIDDYTTLGELLDFKPTSEYMSSLMESYIASNKKGDFKESKIQLAMLRNAPLRLVKSMAKMSATRYESFIENLKRLTNIGES